MTKERILEIINAMPDGTEFFVKHGDILKRPTINSDVINDSHFAKFPFYVPEDEIKPLLGKHVIVIE